MEDKKCCRNCHNHRYGKCEILSYLLNITAIGTKTVDCEECGEEFDVDIDDIDLDDLEVKINNPSDFCCNKWE